MSHHHSAADLLDDKILRKESFFSFFFPWSLLLSPLLRASLFSLLASSLSYPPFLSSAHVDFTKNKKLNGLKKVLQKTRKMGEKDLPS
jgi:hypothetical protein